MPINAQLAALTEKVEQLEQNLVQIEINPFIKDHKERIEHAIDQGSLLDKLELDMRKAEHERLMEEKNIEKVKQELFWDVSDEEIRKLDISTFNKEKVKKQRGRSIVCKMIKNSSMKNMDCKKGI